MSIQIKGENGVVLEVEDNHLALRTHPRPIDVGTLGAYQKAMASGTIGAGLAGASPVYSFRYGGSKLCIVRKVLISAGDLVGFTAGFALFNMFAARAFSASDTGGTAATLTGNNGKLRTSMGTTEVADIRIANTGALSAGTRTKDDDPMATLSASVITTAGLPLFEKAELYRAHAGEWPLILAQNEGFVIEATVPATGTWKLGIDTAWEEVETSRWTQGA